MVNNRACPSSPLASPPLLPPPSPSHAAYTGQPLTCRAKDKADYDAWIAALMKPMEDLALPVNILLQQEAAAEAAKVSKRSAGVRMGVGGSGGAAGGAADDD